MSWMTIVLLVVAVACGGLTELVAAGRIRGELPLLPGQGAQRPGAIPRAHVAATTAPAAIVPPQTQDARADGDD